jgi:hypothetical protein
MTAFYGSSAEGHLRRQTQATQRQLDAAMAKFKTLAPKEIPRA